MPRCGNLPKGYVKPTSSQTATAANSTVTAPPQSSQALTPPATPQTPNPRPRENMSARQSEGADAPKCGNLPKGVKPTSSQTATATNSTVSAPPQSSQALTPPATPQTPNTCPRENISARQSEGAGENLNDAFSYEDISDDDMNNENGMNFICVKLKSDNLQYNMLGHWVDGTNNSTTKHLKFPALFFS